VEATRFEIETKIGPNSAVDSVTGFRTYFNVPIARTGILLYGASERPEVQPGPDGLIRIERLAEDVFEPASLESLQGKPFVNEHHPLVDKNNWRDVAAGTIINPRRGAGIYDDCVVADITVNDAETIADIDAGKREVSADYNPEYYDLGGGRGRQRKIRYNNVALVESGRCGSRCSIQDHSTQREETKMAKTAAKPRTALFKVLRMLGAGLTQDQRGTFDEAIEEAEKETKDNEGELTEPGKKDRTTADSEIGARMDGLEAKHAEHAAKLATHDSDIADLKENKMDKADETKDADKEDKEIEDDLEEEAPKGTGDKARSAKDSAYLASSWGHTKSIAEILVPGIQLPTFDAKGNPKSTYRDICAFRKRAIGLGLLSADTNALVQSVRGGRTLDSAGLEKMTCPQVRQLFFAAGAAKKAANTNDSRGAGHHTNSEGAGGGLGVVAGITAADINRRNAERYGAKK
jgi:hypothetical protein